MLTAKVVAVEVVPSGLFTMIYGFPAVAVALAGMKAISSVELRYVVATLFRLKVTCEPGTNPVPITVSANAGPPAGALVGEMLETVSEPRGATIERVTVLDVPPPGTPLSGLVTQRLAFPGSTSWAGTISPRRKLGLKYAVGNGVPLKYTTELVMKLDPSTGMKM